jgi:DNA-binding beta-propeller fold protein YncE
MHRTPRRSKELTRSALDAFARPAATLALVFGSLGVTSAQQSFVNFETPHVTPLALSADGTRLCAVNTPDAVLEVFDVSGATPVHVQSVPVGLDPVSVRFRSSNEVWVVNHVSDSVSIVDLTLGAVVRTLDTSDEPCDVVFANGRGFVSCAQTDEVLVFDLADLGAAPMVLAIEGEEPRAMATSADGTRVYVAVFESGNRSTILGGGLDGGVLVLNNVVSDPLGPYGGQNPPPNAGAGFSPPIAPGLPVPPRVGHIVKKDALGRWMDDNGGDWTSLVSGANSSRSNRPAGWTVVDNDLVVIDTATLAVSYVEGLMNICMALAVHPITGEVAVVGTDATNEVRFEPNLTGVFLRVQLALANPTSGASVLRDLNPHLDYLDENVPIATRELSVGDPRGVVWNGAGTHAYVAGMGSNNVVRMTPAGVRVGAPIEVGEGPTGVALHEASARLFVLNKFAGSISVVSTVTNTETAEVAFHDASPAAIKVGRKHLYDTHLTSGTGLVACASCHVDARMDRLAWDLGDPSGAMKSSAGQNLGMNVPGLNTGFDNFHPMKGPMTTQTLQDIIGKEPLHWRGDRDGIEEFNGAFTGLQGADATLSAQAMQEFEDFLATIHFQPNPHRTFENTLPTSLALPGVSSAGRFSPAGTPLPNGNATTGLSRYTTANLDGGTLRCVTCHTLPTGLGTDMRLSGLTYVPIAPGPNGERHHGLVSQDGSTQKSIKIAQTRNQIEKAGFSLNTTRSRAGFGALHDGSIPGVAHFLSSPVFSFTSDQDLANMVAFMLSFTGSNLPAGSATSIFMPPGTASKDAHAAVGTQTTLVSIGSAPPAQTTLLTQMLGQASLGRVGLVVKGRIGGVLRGGAQVQGSNNFQMDRAGEVLTSNALFLLASVGSELTFTVVPFGSQTRLGLDRDLDGAFDYDEVLAGSDPADPNSLPSIGASYCGPAVANSTGSPAVISAAGNLSAAANEVRINLAQVPVGSVGYLLNATAAGLVPNAGGSQGTLCLGGSVGRHNAAGLVMTANASGQMHLDLDLTNTPTPTGAVSILAGQTWRYQCWYRDLNPTITSNFSDAIVLTFQ